MKKMKKLIRATIDDIRMAFTPIPPPCDDAAIRARRRVREALEAAGTDPERFVSEWCRAQAEHETEEAAR